MSRLAGKGTIPTVNPVYQTPTRVKRTPTESALRSGARDEEYERNLPQVGGGGRAEVDRKR